eukprot:TRINITY_DN14037_c0_g1_i1.p1 TRINITY_DN14037_c0_g1~~TRINITY_DN14037_c0_g1_i1.p1  ORF type:complete len:214 (+),score=86.63 TRINITY_DN14037_c0_g1_i1:29-643(+)
MSKRKADQKDTSQVEPPNKRPKKEEEEEKNNSEEDPKNQIENFKKKYREKSIEEVLSNGAPLSKEWGLEPINTMDDQELSSLFGEECFELYSSFGDKEKNEIISYIEGGVAASEVNEILGIPSWEDWDEKPLKFDLEKVRVLYPEIAEGGLPAEEEGDEEAEEPEEVEDEGHEDRDQEEDKDEDGDGDLKKDGEDQEDQDDKDD